ncbi:MAG: YfhO family protein [Acidobacteriaceae bacterium]|nr:YfhO family protein [Acidobacteriaceae bacterium]
MPFPKALDTGAPAWVSEPLFKLIRTDYLEERTLPLWNPYQAYGVPLAGDMQSQSFYPLTIALSSCISPRTYNWFILLRLFIAGICAYFYLRIFVSFVAALAGGVTSMLAGYYVLFITMPQLSVDVLLPACLLIGERGLRSTSYRNFVWLALIIFLGLVGGMPESSLVVFTFLFCYLIARIIDDPVFRAAWRQKVAFASIAIAVGFFLSALLLLPFLEFMRVGYDLHRVLNAAVYGLAHDTPGLSIFTYFFPLLYGPPSTSSLAPGWAGVRNYVGVIAFFLTLVSVFTLTFRRQSGDRTLNSLTCFFFVFSVALSLKRYGFPPVNAIGRLPVFNLLRFITYEEVAVSICISMLCAIGLERLVRAEISIPIQALALGASFLLAPMAVILSWKVLYKETVIDRVNPSIPIWAVGLPVFLLFCAALLTIYFRASFVSRPANGVSLHSRLACGILVCLTAEAVLSYLVPMYYGLNHMANTATDPYVGAPFVNELKTRSKTYRIFGREAVLFPQWASAFGLFDIRELNAIYYRKYFPFLRDFLPLVKADFNNDLFDRFTGIGEYQFTNWLQRRLLQLSSVRYLLTATPLTIPNDLIEGFLTQNAGHVIPGREAQISRQVFSLDGVTRVALLEHPPYERLPYHLKIGDETTLYFSYALHPAVFEHSCGYGAEFIIEVKDSNGSIEKLFSKYIDPKHNVNERHWMNGQVSMDKYRGQWVDLLLSTKPGPTGDTCADWATWSNLQLGTTRKAEDSMFKPIFQGEANIYEYDNVLPRAAIYYRAEMQKNEQGVLRRLRDPALDIFRTVVLDSSKLNPEQIAAVQHLSEGESRPVRAASIQSYRSEAVTIEASSDQSGILVLNDSDYPGWTVEIDGHPSSWFTANYLFRGVLLTPGKHRVQFVYRPRSFRLGAGISLGCLFCLVLFPVIQKTRRFQGAKMPGMMKFGGLLSILLLCACSAPKPTTPSLTPELAAELVHFNNKAQTWITYVKKQDATCDYRLDLPDQSSRPTEIDLDHIVFCGNRPSPKEFDASVSFAYDKDAQKWVITRFAS